MSTQELAARENVKLSTIDKSIEKMKLHSARNSQESVELATRSLYLDNLPSAARVFEEGLHAMTTESRTIKNPDTQEIEIVLDLVPDHAMRLKTIESLQKLLASVQPRTPLIDARTQINNPQLASSSGGALSSESIIRQIRARPNFQLTDGDIRSVAQQTEEEIGLQVKREAEEEALDIAEAAAEEEAEYEDEDEA
jgi:hypothetical protein